MARVWDFFACVAIVSPPGQPQRLPGNRGHVRIIDAVVDTHLFPEFRLRWRVAVVLEPPERANIEMLRREAPVDALQTQDVQFFR